VCLTDLIDHMTTESKKIYAASDMEGRFLMFHDALAQWNEDEAQLYIKNRYPGFENHFIKPVGTTCASTIYHDMVPGNSPENAQGLDSFGFADLEFQLRAGMALPLRRCAPDLWPEDAQGGVAPHGADLDGRRRPHKRAHHGGHLGVGAGVRQDHRGQGHYRPRRELPDRPPCAEVARRWGT